MLTPADALAPGVVLAAGPAGGAVRAARARRRDYAAVRARPRHDTVAVTIGRRVAGNP
ncbi:hypothetical protein [Pseudonocardia sediminis]|uniref:hypothetical protein n=1 Tax=Pseudonocardia sediminis TaxID=1397368 RepID=UPI0013EF22EA|nr:hypothetical protein [Pseudonocardia sediminis]